MSDVTKSHEARSMGGVARTFFAGALLSGCLLTPAASAKDAPPAVSASASATSASASAAASACSAATACEKACDAGDAPACLSAAKSFASGTGDAKQDAKKAEELTAKAVKLLETACPKEPTSCGRLAGLYLGGAAGIAKDPKRAAKYLSAGCQAKDAASCHDLGQVNRLLLNDMSAAAKAYASACALGNAQGCGHIGTMHEEGTSVAKSAKKAAEYYDRGCTLGHGRSCGRLAALVRAGTVGKADPARALELEKRGCSLKWGEACRALGDALRADPKAGYAFDGKGGYVSKAALAYEDGCTLQDAPACVTLSGLYAKGTGVQQSDAMALRYLDDACKCGDGASCKAVKAQRKKAAEDNLPMLFAQCKKAKAALDKASGDKKAIGSATAAWMKATRELSEAIDVLGEDDPKRKASLTEEASMACVRRS